MNSKNIRRLISIILIIIILFVAYRVIGEEVIYFFGNIDQIDLIDFIYLCLVFLIYIGLYSYAYYVEISIEEDQVSFWNSVEINTLGYFTTIASMGAGTVPLQTYYLHKRDVQAGKAIGSLIYRYIFHRLGVSLIALGTLVLSSQGIAHVVEENTEYLIFGFIINFMIIIGFLLISSSSKVQGLVQRLVQRLPDSKRLKDIKASLDKNIHALKEESIILEKNPKKVIYIILINIVKLGVLYTIPYLAFRAIGVQEDFLLVWQLSSLMLLLGGALPSVSGLGPIELAYIVVFEPIFGRGVATSSMLLYRAATYIFPFFLGFAIFILRQKNFVNKD